MAGASKSVVGMFGSTVEIARGEEFLGDGAKVEERERIVFLLKDEEEVLGEMLAAL